MTDAPTLFDPAFYLSRLGAGTVPLARAWSHHLRHPDADPSPYFDAAYYQERYPDWRNSGARVPLQDYLLRLERGEERQTHPLIDPAFYRAQLPELPVRDGAAIHFARHGDAEGRAPSAGFDALFYRQCYMPLQATHPFAHYVTAGRLAGYLPAPMPRCAGEAAEALPPGLDLVVFGHDAQSAGAQMLLLAILRTLTGQGVKVALVLQRAGPMLDDYRAVVPVVILAEGWPVDAIVAGLPDGLRVLTNTVLTLDAAALAAQRGAPVLSLIHELPYSIADWGLGPLCERAARAGVRFGVSSPFVGDGLAGLLPEPLRGARRAVLGAGLYAEPPKPAQIDAVRAALPSGRLVLGMGHADRRKGFDLFLDTAALIHARDSGARAAWIGALDPWAQGLAEDALAAGLPLLLPGCLPLDQASAWMASAAVLLVTARAETGPSTLIEALCIGTPVAGFADGLGLGADLERYGHGVGGYEPADLATAALAAMDGGRLVPAALTALRDRYDFANYCRRMMAAHPDPLELQ